MMSHLLAIFIKPTVTSVNILYVIYEFIGLTLDIENLHTKQRKAEICDIPFDIALNKLLSLIYDIIDKLHANNIIKSDADILSLLKT